MRHDFFRIAFSTVLAAALVWAGLRVAEAAGKPIPKQLPQLKSLKLGEPTAKFLADFSEDEKESAVHGVRIFTVRGNTLPTGVAALRCDFQDGKLVFIEAELDAASSAQPWTTFVGTGIAQYGPANSADVILGANRLHGARFDESAGWSDRTVALVYGRAASGARAYFLGLVDEKYLPLLTQSLNAVDAQEIAAKQSAEEEARRQRDAADQEAKRQQEAKDAETKRLRDELEARRQQEAKDALEKRRQEELKVPVALRFGPIPTIFSRNTELALAATAVNKAGDPIPEYKPDFKVTPATVATVTAGGGVRCITSGDAVVSGAAGQVTHEESVSCRLVRSVTAPTNIRLVVQNQPVSPEIAVLTFGNRPLPDVVPTITVADPTIAQVDGRRLRGVGVGATTATVTAGDETATINLEVVSNIKNEPILLNEGSRISYALPQGHFEVRVKLKANAGVTLTWVGGNNCTDVAESADITTSCAFSDAGSFIVENPRGGVWDSRIAADGVLTIYQIP